MSLVAGAPIEISCGNCPTSAVATLRVGGVIREIQPSFGRARELQGDLDGLQPGSYPVTVECGEREFADVVNVVGATLQSGSAGGSGAATAAVLLFFLLSGALFMPRSGGPRRPLPLPRRRT